MKTDTSSALFGNLIIEQFKFETINSSHKQTNIDTLIECINKCDIVPIKDKNYFRARNIGLNDPNIKYDANGIPIQGYTSKLSGVAPIQCISAGRVNNPNEQVLYIAEDSDTAIKEARVIKYASVASCKFEQRIQVFDFSPYTNIQLDSYCKHKFSDDLDSYLFTEMQKILTMPEYNINDYIISRDLVFLMKQYWKNVSGIMYISSFTSKINLAIWDDNKYITFSDGSVIRSLSA